MSHQSNEQSGDNEAVSEIEMSETSAASHHVAFASSTFASDGIGNNNNNDDNNDNEEDKTKESKTQNKFGDISQDEVGFMLYKALSDAGRLSNCVVAAEVWMLDDNRSKLMQPPGGMWICPAFYHCGGENEEAMLRLTDVGRDDYVPPAPLIPGSGLAGALFAEVSGGDKTMMRRGLLKKSKSISNMTLFSRGVSTRTAESRRSESSAYSHWTLGKSPSKREAEIDAAADRKILNMEEQQQDGDDEDNHNNHIYENEQERIFQGNLFHNVMDRRRIAWREVTALAIDPDQPYNPRLNLLAKAGFGLAAGVPFNIHGVRGIVVYMTRESADQERMKTQQNESYLLAATTVCGAICAFQAQRRIALERKQRESTDMLRNFREQFKRALGKREVLDDLSNHDGKSLHSTATMLNHRIDGIDENSNAESNFGNEKEGTKSENAIKRPILSFLRYVTSRLMLSGRKFINGGNNQPPPPMPWTQSLFTFLGTFITLIIILQVNEGITDASDGGATMVLGPFGALMALQYGLTAAPASQPRNAILGNILSMSIAMALSYADNVEKWIRQALGTSIAVACMSKLGLIHPPAGAAALIFSGGGYDWKNIGVNMLGNVVAIIVASLINNLNEKRQYPTYWGLTGHWLDLLYFWKGFSKHNKEVLEVDELKKRKQKGTKGA